MDTRDHVGERCEAFAQQSPALEAHPRRVARRRRWWRGLAWGVGLLGLVSRAPASQAADFACAAGEVACLIDAINTANANGEANTITLEAGTYTLTAVDHTTEGPTGLPSITSTLVLSGAGPDATIIERAGGTLFPPDANAPAFRLLHIAASGTLTLEGLTVQGGRVDLDTDAAGILNRGTLTLRHSVVRLNRAGTFSSSAAGGGLLNLGTATLTHCTFSSNVLRSGAGGGVWNTGTMTIDHCTFDRNSVDGDGGGIGNEGTLLLTDSTLTHNDAVVGGGIANNGTLVVINSTLAGNGASLVGVGGGLFNTGSGGTVTLLNSTLVDNGGVRSGGGVANGAPTISSLPPGTVVLLNTLLARNQLLVGSSAADCVGPITSRGHNLIGDPIGCTITLQPSDLTGDPGLGDFTDAGTPGHGHVPLRPDSPAIDRGSEADCAASAPTDQLDTPRNGRCDIGAIEFYPVVNTLVTLRETEIVTAFDPTPVPGGPAGTFRIHAPFTNTSAQTIGHPFSAVTELSGGNLLLNADGGPGGVGARLTPPGSASTPFPPGATATFQFVIGLQTSDPFTFFIDLFGSPETPTPAALVQQ